jgi:glucarate dehydratase
VVWPDIIALPMKVVDIQITPVTVPMEAPLRWSMGVETGTTRGIIRAITDEGIIGIGETYGGNGITHAIEIAKPYVLGLNPLDIGILHHRLGVFRIGYETAVPAVVRAGIEMAFYDAAAKALNCPIYSLLGGKVHDRIETSAYLFYRYKSNDGKTGGEASAKAMVERAQELVSRFGFRAIKFKGGVYPPEEEMKCLRCLRSAFPDAPLRWDPNAAWSVETSIRMGRKLISEGIDLEYLEDPTWNLEGMSKVRQAVPLPLATNMCLVSFEQLAPGIRMHSVDIILADVHFWGGFRENQRMMAVCDAFQLGIGMHSDRELGISTAAMLHLAAASPSITYAIDSHYHDQVDDILTEPFTYNEGHLQVPDGPGLGVEVDWDKVDRYHRLYNEQGQVNEFYDTRRPHWVPALPLF